MVTGVQPDGVTIAPAVALLVVTYSSSVSPAETDGVVRETVVPDLVEPSADAAYAIAGPLPAVGLAVPVNGELVAPWLSVTTRVKFSAPASRYA